MSWNWIIGALKEYVWDISIFNVDDKEHVKMWFCVDSISYISWLERVNSFVCDLDRLTCWESVDASIFIVICLLVEIIEKENKFIWDKLRNCKHLYLYSILIVLENTYSPPLNVIHRWDSSPTFFSLKNNYYLFTLERLIIYFFILKNYTLNILKN